ncbi:MAG: hypothetical protein U0793_02995 [Gemmataceae bacterium]
MKAEERKELETNVLADRVGKIVQTVKSGPSRRFVLLLVLAVVVIAGVLFYMRSKRLQREEKAEGWSLLALTRGISPFDDSHVRYFQTVLQKYKEEKSGLAAHVEIAWMQALESMRQFRAKPVESLIELTEHASRFDALKKRCKDDRSLHPEVLYDLGVIHEYRAVLDEFDFSKVKAAKTLEALGNVPEQKYLDKAKEYYEAVVKEYKESGYAKMAADRLKAFEERGDEIKALNRFFVGGPEFLSEGPEPLIFAIRKHELMLLTKKAAGPVE